MNSAALTGTWGRGSEDEEYDGSFEGSQRLLR